MFLPIHRSVQVLTHPLRPSLHPSTAYPLALHRFSPQSSSPYSKITNRTKTTSAGYDVTSGPSSPAPHKRITLTGDDGCVPWGELSPAEKIVRTTQQSFNFTVIIVGGILTVCSPPSHHLHLSPPRISPPILDTSLPSSLFLKAKD